MSMAFLMEDPTRSRTHPPSRVAITAVTMVTPPKVRSIDSRPTPNSSWPACTSRLVRCQGGNPGRGKGGGKHAGWIMGFRYYSLVKAKGVGQRPRGSGLDHPRTERCNHRCLARSSCQETFTGSKKEALGRGGGGDRGHWWRAPFFREAAARLGVDAFRMKFLAQGKNLTWGPK